jgi:hypothetical protein
MHTFSVKRDKVISIHNCMNQSIENNCEVHITIIANIQIQPIKLFLNKRHIITIKKEVYYNKMNKFYTKKILVW